MIKSFSNKAIFCKFACPIWTKYESFAKICRTKVNVNRPLHWGLSCILLMVTVAFYSFIKYSFCTICVTFAKYERRPRSQRFLMSLVIWRTADWTWIRHSNPSVLTSRTARRCWSSVFLYWEKINLKICCQMNLRYLYFADIHNTWLHHV